MSESARKKQNIFRMKDSNLWNLKEPFFLIQDLI
jgi:hypothetical protein